VLVPPQLNKPFKLYVAADTQTIGSALIPAYWAMWSTSIGLSYEMGY
jgi:hypothetical protein